MATRAEAALNRKRHPDSGRFVRQRGNGHTPDAGFNTPLGVGGLDRMLRPQAAFRWILPNRAAITPQYVEMVMRGALAGNHVQQWEIFDFMLDSWPALSSCLQELTDGVMSKKLVFEPHCDEDEKPTPEAIDRMKLVSAALRAMQPSPDRDENDLSGTIKDLLGSWLYGITCLEVLWDSVDVADIGQIVAPRSTFWVHPVAYGFNANGQLGLRTVGNYSTNGTGTLPRGPNLGRGPNPPTYASYPLSYLSAQPQPATLEAFPDHKFLIGLHKAKPGTALGGPLLRPLVWWWVAAGYCEDWLLNLAQLYGIPFRWVTYDPSVTPDVRDAIDAMLQNMGNAGYARFPRGTELNLMDVGAGRQAQYTPQGTMLDRADRYARELILGQTMTGSTMTSGKGGQAFGIVEKDVKQERIDAAGKYCCEVINKQLIASILLLNYGDATEAPRIRLFEENEGQFVDAQRDQILIKAGLEIGVDYLRKKYGIPEPAEAEETLGGQPAPFPGTPFGMAGLPEPNETGEPERMSESQPGMEKGASLKSAAGAYAPGHQFYGNQHVRLGDHVLTPHGEGVVISNTDAHHVWVSHNDGSVRRVERATVKVAKKATFPSITHSAENERRQLRNLGLITKQGPTGSIYIVRHGSTTMNGGDKSDSPDIIRGHKDVPLSDKGKRQALQLGDDLSDKGIKKIFTSDLSRASDTAQAIADKLPEKPHVFELRGLRPWSLGKNIEGKRSSEMVGTIAHYVDNPDEAPDSGETFNQFSTRFLNTMKHIRQDHGDEPVAVVTHHRGVKLLQATAGGLGKFDKNEFNDEADSIPPGTFFKLQPGENT